jgi:hypothetical protein
VSDIQRKSKSEVALEIEQLNYRITSLVHENEALKSEVTVTDGHELEVYIVLKK